MKYAYLLAGVALAGCAVGPEFQPPQASLDTRFVNSDAAAIGAVAEESWWTGYQDPTLTALVTQGLAQNLDVMKATEAIRQAEAQLRATGVTGSLSGSLSGARELEGGELVDGTNLADSASLGASLVIDLFGGVKREREAALAGVSSAQAAVETTRLAWLAELISAYANARTYQELLALTRDTIRAREETVSITQEQFNIGSATEYEVAQAEALLSTARAALPQYAALFDAQVYAMATLLNQPAGPLMTRMERGAPQLKTPAGSRTGVPADLLRNRPDIRGLEASLAAATATVGVAEAALYPSLSLTGSVARTDGVDAWSFGPSLSLPILNQGVLRANRDAQISAAKQAEIDWRAGVLSAVEDVQVANSNLSRYRQRATALRQAASDYDRALQLAQENYRNGATTLLDLLDTDRSAASARISAASAANDAAQAWATLKIATGAGAAVGGGS